MTRRLTTSRALQSGLAEQQQPVAREASEASSSKRARDTAARTWVYEGATQKEETVLQRVFSKMRTKYGDVYADEAQTRRKFDRSVDVLTVGHLEQTTRTYTPAASHPSSRCAEPLPAATWSAPAASSARWTALL